MKKIKALLLAAGFGTRLRPLTLTTPKCLVQVNGLTLLEHWIIKLKNLGCEEVMINTHYLSEKVEDFLKGYKDKRIKIHTSYENPILGTAGTLIKHLEFFKNSTGLLIHADNYTNDDLINFINMHNLKPKDCLLTMLTFTTDNPSSCGIVQKDEMGRIIKFYEKSRHSHGFCANGALYAFDEDFVSFIGDKSHNFTDFSNEIIPLLIGRIFSWHTTKTYMDIGNVNALKKANSLHLRK